MIRLNLLFIVAAWLMSRQASVFIRSHQGSRPGAVSRSLIVLLFSLVFIGCSQQPYTQEALFRVGVFLLWGVLFTLTDISNHWLPRRFTVSFTLCGALMVAVFNGGDALIRHTAVWLSLGLVFYLSAKIAVKCRACPQGLGDTLLVSGCGFWLEWQQLCFITGISFLLLFIHALVINKRVLPLAPYFYLVFSVGALTGLLIIE